ncbi:MAG: oligosaccharide translocation protein RFT1, partial [Ilumatobacteraceae bacterium]
SLSTSYGQALMYYGAAAFIELCAEPHYIRAMRMSAFKLRLFAETASTVLRSVLTYALVSMNQSDVVLAFAYSQVRINYFVCGMIPDRFTDD